MHVHYHHPVNLTRLAIVSDQPLAYKHSCIDTVQRDLSRTLPRCSNCLASIDKQEGL